MAIILSAFFLVHIVIAVVAFFCGAVFGCSTVQVMHPNGGGGPVRPLEHGVTGGLNALGTVVIIYVFSLGIAPLVISSVTAAIAWAATRHLGAEQ